jgi:branched-chain amino acid transport system substrate-binding protein
MRKIVMSTVLLAVLGLFVSTQTYAAEPIKFGLIHSLSGGIGQVFGVPDLKAAQMAVDEINKAGGILGHPLEMIVRDDKLNPENGVREAKDLILNHKVKWIQGTVSSAVALAISAYCKEAKVPFVITTAQSADLTNLHSHRYLFRTTAQTNVTSRGAAYAAAKKWGGKKIFFIGPDYEFGHRCKSDFMKAYTKLVPDAQIVGELWPKLGNQDWTPYITKIMAADADFVYSALWGGDVIAFTKAAAPFGYFDRIKQCGQEWGLVEVLSRMDKKTYPKGVLGGGYYPFWLLDNPMSNKYWRKFNETSGGLNAGISVSAYITLYAMKQAIERVKAVDMEKAIDVLEGIELDAVVGKVKIRACDHQIMWPFWMGSIAVSSDLPWPHIVDTVKLDPADGYMSCSEIAQARKSKK